LHLCGDTTCGSTKTEQEGKKILRFLGELELWIALTDLEGFKLGYVTTPGSFVDVGDLLIPELRGRGIYPEEAKDALTAGLFERWSY
jgi:hypothetical protein